MRGSFARRAVEVLRLAQGSASCPEAARGFSEVLGMVEALCLESLLRDLDDLAPDEPVRVDHRRVDRSRNARAHLLEDRGDALGLVRRFSTTRKDL